MPLLKLIRAQEELNEQRLASFPQQNPNPVIESDSHGRVTFANNAALTIAKELGFKNVSVFLPKDLKKIIKYFQTKRLKQVYREINFGKITLEESIHWSSQFNVVRIFIRDITTRKQAEEKLKNLNEHLEDKIEERTSDLAKFNRALTMLSACNKALIYSQSEKELLQKISRIIVEVGGYRWAWIGQVENDEQKSVQMITQLGTEEGYLESANITWSAKDVRGRGPIGKAIRAGRFFVGKNFSKDADLVPWRIEALKRGFRSVIALPLKNKEEVYGILVIYARDPDAFNKEEIRLLYELSEDLAFGINTLREKEHHEETEALIRASNELLKLSNQSSSRQEYLDGVVQYIKKWSGCAFVGIRILQREEFIPYESYTGFSHDFWQSENMLSLKKDQCACIRVIAGKPDPQDRPALSKAGAFYTNNSAGFIASLSKKAQARFRGKCVRCGFASLAVIPIRRRETVLGAIHIADKKRDKLLLKKVEMLESLAVLIGEAVNKFNAQERLIESYSHLGFINRKIPVLLELDKHSQNARKKEISEYVLNSAANVSGSDLGLLYRYEDNHKFRLVAHRGISHVEVRKINFIESKACQYMRSIINKKKEKTRGLPKEAFHKCFGIAAHLEYFIILPLWKKMDKKTKGFIMLGFKDDKNLDTSDLEFYDVFSMHASAALLSAEVLR
ncbi:MAG: hypothetical protein A2Z52_00600 [Candidatus Moranbacteria bacterium RBG_19FT_COMBO_42_6]|nr:MAG: hypothetical protein A2Z52_00600 [Candidatus Moranbacteria bacterium RBG_19FT_COMBO_42_6]